MTNHGIIIVVVGVVLFVLGFITVLLNANSTAFDWGEMPQEFLIGVFLCMCGLAFLLVGGITIIINRDS